MCGIAGIVDRSGPSSKVDIDRMCDLLIHRGPDAKGVWIEEGRSIAFGHRRLSILDISSASDQPFTSASGRIKLVFNGEVYNYKELIKAYDIKCRTSGDTEVVVELLDRFGLEALRLFKGMFAMAWTTLDTDEVFLARDHAGIKPLYYTEIRGGLVFASELRAIASVFDSLKISLSNVKEFLELGFFGKDRCIYEGVKKVLPGEVITYKNHVLKKDCYSSYSIQKGSISNFRDAKNRFKQLMNDSVAHRLISDRPTGVFLSGGIDSSLVTHFASKVSDRKIDSYCVQMVDSAHDESRYAEKVAKHLGTDHHTIPIEEKTIKDELLNVLDLLDEPFGDSSIIPSYVLTKHVSDKVTVALAGDGGDELFMGYGMYNWPNRLERLPLVASKIGFHLFKRLSLKKQKDYSKYFNFSSKASIHQNTISQEMGCFHSTELSQIIRKPTEELELIYDRDLVDIDSLDPAEIQSYLDYKNYLPDDLLCKVDRASMYNSVEVRVPFLDKAMVEFAFSLPVHMKHHMGNGKIILKSVLEEILPKELVYRKKWGFSIQLDKWLLNEFSFLIDTFLSPSLIESISWLDNEYTQSIITRFRKGEHYLYMRIWLLIQLVSWMKKLPNGPPET